MGATVNVCFGETPNLYYTGDRRRSTVSDWTLQESWKRRPLCHLDESLSGLATSFVQVRTWGSWSGVVMMIIMVSPSIVDTKCRILSFFW